MSRKALTDYEVSPDACTVEQICDGLTIKRYAPITKPEKLAKDIEEML
ncbi:MAG: hypothetical protein IJ142_02750 [Bacteroidaceae bacterium]|nr:hypothetical protein [Bacteroidaceae bacterium]MBQ9190506.1 hypothetical protein [Bacteroidaceae bacterium]